MQLPYHKVRHSAAVSQDESVFRNGRKRAGVAHC
jgi:hypothetical protein